MSNYLPILWIDEVIVILVCMSNTVHWSLHFQCNKKRCVQPSPTSSGQQVDAITGFCVCHIQFIFTSRSLTTSMQMVGIVLPWSSSQKFYFQKYGFLFFPLYFWCAGVTEKVGFGEYLHKNIVFINFISCLPVWNVFATSGSLTYLNVTIGRNSSTLWDAISFWWSLFTFIIPAYLFSIVVHWPLLF